MFPDFIWKIVLNSALYNTIRNSWLELQVYREDIVR